MAAGCVKRAENVAISFEVVDCLQWTSMRPDGKCASLENLLS